MVSLNDQKHKRKLYGVCISGIKSLGVASPLQQKLALICRLWQKLSFTNQHSPTYYRVSRKGVRVVLLELVDRLDSKSNIVRCIGSSPIDYTREVKFRKGRPETLPASQNKGELL